MGILRGNNSSIPLIYEISILKFLNPYNLKMRAAIITVNGRGDTM